MIAYACDAGVGTVACYAADHIEISITATDCATVPNYDATGLFLVCGDGTLNLQVLDESVIADIAEDCRTFALLVDGVDGDGVSLSVEESLIVETVSANHGSVGTLVDVGRQHGIEIGLTLTTIHEFCEGNKVLQRTDLIDAAHFG